MKSAAPAPAKRAKLAPAPAGLPASFFDAKEAAARKPRSEAPGPDAAATTASFLAELQPDLEKAEAREEEEVAGDVDALHEQLELEQAQALDRVEELKQRAAEARARAREAAKQQLVQKEAAPAADDEEEEEEEEFELHWRAKRKGVR